MDDQDIKAFAGALGKLAMATGWNLSEGEVEVYWDDLREQELKDVLMVLSRWRRESERFPRLSQVLDECQRIAFRRRQDERRVEVRLERLLSQDSEATRPATREEIRELLIAAGLRLKPSREPVRIVEGQEGTQSGN